MKVTQATSTRPMISQSDPQKQTNKSLAERTVSFTVNSNLIKGATGKKLDVQEAISNDIVRAKDNREYRLSRSKNGPIGELLGLPGGMQSGASSSSSNDPYRHLRSQAGQARGLDAAQILTRIKKHGLEGFLQQIGQTLPPQVRIDDLVQIKKRDTTKEKSMPTMYPSGLTVVATKTSVERPTPFHLNENGKLYQASFYLQELPESIAALRYKKKHNADIFFAKPNGREIDEHRIAQKIYAKVREGHSMFSVIISNSRQWSNQHVTPILAYFDHNSRSVFLNLNDSGGSTRNAAANVAENIVDILKGKNIQVDFNKSDIRRQSDGAGCHTDGLHVSKEFLADRYLAKWVSQRGKENDNKSIFPAALLKTAQSERFKEHHSSSGITRYSKKDENGGIIQKSLESHAAKHSAPTRSVHRSYIQPDFLPNSTSSDRRQFVSDYIRENPRAVASSVEGVVIENVEKDYNLFLQLKTLEYASAAAVHLTEASKVLSTPDFQGYIEHLRNTRNL